MNGAPKFNEWATRHRVPWVGHPPPEDLRLVKGGATAHSMIGLVFGGNCREMVKEPLQCDTCDQKPSIPDECASLYLLLLLIRSFVMEEDIIVSCKAVETEELKSESDAGKANFYGSMNP